MSDAGTPDRMETMQEALDRLRAAGYRDELAATERGFVSRETDTVHAPEDLVVDEIVRFEGRSDPQDEAVLLALEDPERGVRATFVSTFGIHADPVAAELMRRLDEGRNER